MRSVEATIDLAMSPQEVLDVFIKQEHLKAWWGVDRSLIEPIKGGIYSLVWQSADHCVEYVTSGIVAEYLPACQLRVEKIVYINPQRPVLGPLELLILTTPQEDYTTQLTIIESGYQSGPHWDWHYRAVERAWPDVLQQIKTYLHSISIG